MSDLLKSNFSHANPVQAQAGTDDARAAFRKTALESIAGSMVFVEDRLLYWDLLDE